MPAAHPCASASLRQWLLVNGLCMLVVVMFCSVCMHSFAKKNKLSLLALPAHQQFAVCTVRRTCATILGKPAPGIWES